MKKGKMFFKKKEKEEKIKKGVVDVTAVNRRI